MIDSMRLTKFICLTLLSLAFTGCVQVNDVHVPAHASPVERAVEQRQRDVQVGGEGVITRILSDDEQGSRHQRFIIKLKSGNTLLIQQNIDLAPRVTQISEGDVVQFFGEYIWNEQGGLVHWTHHDPAGRHVPGWLRHNGRTYQ